ncbi:O-antigen polymerase [Phocaeicola sp.]
MIFILIILLSVSLLIAYKCFNNVIAPPVLMSVGMLAASLLVCLFYREWEIDKLQSATCWLLGGGTLCFTLSCVAFLDRNSRKKTWCKSELSLDFIIIHRVRLFYIVSNIIGGLCLFLKIYHLKSFFGNLAIPLLIGASRVEAGEGDNLFHFPSIVRMMGSYTSVLSFLTIWLISIKILSKSKIKERFLSCLLVGQLLLTVFDAFLSGAKGNLISVIFQFLIIYLIVFYSRQGSYVVNKKILVKVFIILALLIVSFKGLSLLMGRVVEKQSNSALVAEYCGAEIKNFDIYIKSRSSLVRSKSCGAVTFGALYRDFGSDLTEPDSEGFQSMGDYTLGNVYTQFYAFHKDFGSWGCFLVPFLFAAISMFCYRKAICMVSHPMKFNAYVFIYASIAMSVFMSFFSCKFTETNMNLGYFRSIFYLCVMQYFFKKYLLNSSLKK